MRIGVPKETKDNEYRVGLTPSSVSELIRSGHELVVERGAGLGAGFTDSAYEAAGAAIVDGPDAIFENAELIVKVKEPLPVERWKLRPDQILFTYLHLAPDPELTHDLVGSGAICIAYETVTSPSGGLPLLTPMSEVAGRLAPQIGAHFLEKQTGGRGVLLAGVPGVPAAEVVILGAGVVGSHAAAIALGMGANVVVADRNPEALRRLDSKFGGAVRTVFSTETVIREIVKRADLLIGAVLLAGARTPTIVSMDMVPTMKPGAVIVDVAIDQGGCCESSRPTSHSDPVYVREGIIHYCVTNMPGAVPRTSTFALNNATLPFVQAIADKGWRRALREDEHLRAGLQIFRGKVTSAPVAKAQRIAHLPVESALGPLS
ncbi:alanine dehydrogenase [Rhodoblastus sp. 17X3]|uniref:alanine dehydrogenase n=1 Tax=Rhodoblastus sp. 17X3 TaxID=3047026 RepID=UPI0024B67E8F|nr:alanine dehydrogenase [Rhodoblastus sp. 17X3]MDI9848562.1 alanine dehydrogenase [Rhodoblastus sp. 17X3]